MIDINICAGYGSYPDAVAILLGIFTCCCIAYFLSAPTENSAQQDKFSVMYDWVQKKTGMGGADSEDATLRESLLDVKNS